MPTIITSGAGSMKGYGFSYANLGGTNFAAFFVGSKNTYCSFNSITLDKCSNVIVAGGLGCGNCSTGIPNIIKVNPKTGTVTAAVRMRVAANSCCSRCPNPSRYCNVCKVLAVKTDNSNNIFVSGGAVIAKFPSSLASITSHVNLPYLSSCYYTGCFGRQAINNLGIDSSCNIYSVSWAYPGRGVCNNGLSLYKFNNSLSTCQIFSVNNGKNISTSGVSSSSIDSSGNSYIMGNYVVSCFTQKLVKYNSSGTKQWEIGYCCFKVTSGGGTTQIFVNGIVADASGRVTSSSSETLSGTRYVFVQQTNSTGTGKNWIFTINQNQTCGNKSVCLGGNQGRLAVDSCCNVYLSGQVNCHCGSTCRSRGLVVKINSSGVVQWQRQFKVSGSIDVNGGPIYVSGCNYYVSFNYNTTGNFLLSLPKDGSKTGSISIPGSYTICYAPTTLITKLTTATSSSTTSYSLPVCSPFLTPTTASVPSTSTPSYTKYITKI